MPSVPGVPRQRSRWHAAGRPGSPNRGAFRRTGRRRATRPPTAPHRRNSSTSARRHSHHGSDRVGHAVVADQPCSSRSTSTCSPVPTTSKSASEEASTSTGPGGPSTVSTVYRTARPSREICRPCLRLLTLRPWLGTVGRTPRADSQGHLPSRAAATRAQLRQLPTRLLLHCGITWHTPAVTPIRATTTLGCIEPDYRAATASAARAMLRVIPPKTAPWNGQIAHQYIWPSNPCGWNSARCV
jgi:hypothetical protein